MHLFGPQLRIMITSNSSLDEEEQDAQSITRCSMEHHDDATSSVVDTSTNANNSSNSGTTVTAGNLTTAVTDLIFCATTFSPSSDGSGYTAGVVTGDQYILNQSAGTISTSYGVTAAQWAVAAVAFKSGAVTVMPTGIGSTFSVITNPPTIQAGATVIPAAVSATFGTGSRAPS